MFPGPTEAHALPFATTNYEADEALNQVAISAVVAISTESRDNDPAPAGRHHPISPHGQRAVTIADPILAVAASGATAGAAWSTRRTRQLTVPASTIPWRLR